MELVGGGCDAWTAGCASRDVLSRPSAGRRLDTRNRDGEVHHAEAPRGFDPASNRFIYLYNTNFGRQEPSAFGLSQQFQTQLGVRYSF